MKKLIIILYFIFISNIIYTQSQNFKSTTNSYISIYGTSTFYDINNHVWEMISENITSEIIFNTYDKNFYKYIEYASFKVNVNTLKSDKSGINNRAYKALKIDDHPQIVFYVRKNNNFKINKLNNIIGELTIAGITQQVNIKIICTLSDNEKMICEGSCNIKMSDFGVELPVLFLGALRLNDEVIIKFKIIYL